MPDFKSFAEHARDHRTIPVVRVLPSDLLTPVAAFLRLAQGEPYAFLLESVEGGEHVGRYTFLGIRPYMRVEARGEDVLLMSNAGEQRRSGEFLDIVSELMRDASSAADAELYRGLPPFSGGFAGYLSYDIVRRWEPVPSLTRDETNLPDAALMFFDRIVAFDHATQQLYLIASVRTKAGESEARLRSIFDEAGAWLEQTERRLAEPLHQDQRVEYADPVIDAASSRAEFMQAVERAKEYIAAGDAFQIVLSLRLRLQLPEALPAFEVYRALRRVNPSPYMYFLRMGELEVLGSSPEMLVKVNAAGRELEYRPIAGTRRRGKNVEEDLALEEELRASEKEVAEHVMLVDLGRNDLGRVSEYGSVHVARLMFVERYSHVMHLVSSLKSKLRAELTAFDALRACFPAGTLSGAPKVRAMQIIEELEPVRRGIYGGCILYADFAGNLDSCIAIRTMVVQSGRAYVQAGAGIVADSQAEEEYQECMNKAAALLRAVRFQQ